MLIAVVGAIIGIVLFLALYLGFRTGLRLGIQTAKGITPEPVKNPAKVIADTARDIKLSAGDIKANKEFSEGFQALMNYNGDLPKNGR